MFRDGIPYPQGVGKPLIKNPCLRDPGLVQQPCGEAPHWAWWSQLSTFQVLRSVPLILFCPHCHKMGWKRSKPVSYKIGPGTQKGELNMEKECVCVYPMCFSSVREICLTANTTALHPHKQQCSPPCLRFRVGNRWITRGSRREAERTAHRSQAGTSGEFL